MTRKNGFMRVARQRIRLQFAHKYAITLVALNTSGGWALYSNTSQHPLIILHTADDIGREVAAISGDCGIQQLRHKAPGLHNAPTSRLATVFIFTSSPESFGNIMFVVDFGMLADKYRPFSGPGSFYLDKRRKLQPGSWGGA